MSIYAMADRLLSALKLDSSDHYNTEVALRIIEQFGSFEAAMGEISKEKYNRLRYTPEVMLHSMVEMKDEGEQDFIAAELANKLYALRGEVMRDAASSGVLFSDKLAEVDVIASLALDPLEAWTVYFAGGKKFIEDMNKVRDGESVKEMLIRAMKAAEKKMNTNTDHLGMRQSVEKIEYKKQ